MIGALIGIFGSLIPSFIKLFQDWQDKKHELKILELQIQYAEKSEKWKMEEITIQKEAEMVRAAYEYTKPQQLQVTGKTWIDALQVISNFIISTTRPLVTYWLLLVYTVVKYAEYKLMVASGQDWYRAVAEIWTSTDNEFVAAVVMFWFANRAILRISGMGK